MKLRVLVDNNTYIDAYYLGEPAISYYLEDNGKKILFDVGYSDVFMKNATAMGIDVSKVDYLVLSHGHNDHTGGLKEFVQIQNRVSVGKSCTIVTHPNTFEKKRADQLDISSPVDIKSLEDVCNVMLTRKPYYITEQLIYLGEIPRSNDYEAKLPVGEHLVDHVYENDYVLDDSALVYQTKEGIYMITGCSHAGICNIIEYAKHVTHESRVLGIVGGFHLFEKNEQTMKTIDYLKKEKIQELYPCHCTSFCVKSYMNRFMEIGEVGVGMSLQW